MEHLYRADRGCRPRSLGRKRHIIWSVSIESPRYASGTVRRFPAQSGTKAKNLPLIHDWYGASSMVSMSPRMRVCSASIWRRARSTVGFSPHNPKSTHLIPAFGDKSGIVFASPQEGFITGGQTGQTAEKAMLWRTIDGGNNWLQVALPVRPNAVLNWTFARTFFTAEKGVIAVEANNTQLPSMPRMTAARHGPRDRRCRSPPRNGPLFDPSRQ